MGLHSVISQHTETTHQKGLKRKGKEGMNRQITEGIGGLVPSKIGPVLPVGPEKYKGITLKAQ